MTLLAPGYLLAALAATLALVAVHLIAWRQPPDLVLPTARFVPDEAARQTARTVRLTDVALLTLRASVLLLAGLALARPVIEPARRGAAQLIAVDVSRDVADLQEARDSVAAARRPANTAVVLAFDTAARVTAADVAVAPEPRAAGALSPMLVAMSREANRLATRHERVDLVIVSPFLEREFDAATLALRTALRDSIRLVRIRAAPEAPAAGEVTVRAPGDDAVAAGIRLGVSSGLVARATDVRVVRDTLTAADSAWVASGPRVLVWWPMASVEARAGEAGEVSGVATEDATLIGHLLPTAMTAGAPVARWLDGTLAAGSMMHGQGCIRAVGFDLPRSGDLALTPPFQRVAGALLRPCSPRGGAPAADSLLARLAAAPPGDRGRDLVRASPTAEPNRLGAVLLVLAVVAAAGEAIARRRPAFRSATMQDAPEGT